MTRCRLLLMLLLLPFATCFAQSPGQIVRPAGGSGATILNPNGDAYSSATAAGFVTSDITQSEILYKIVPPAVNEPTGDIATGPSGGFTDIVKTIDNSGFYVYSDGTNLLFRLRIGNIINGSKGYSVLIDTDGKMGNTGPAPDPNYVAATNTSNGNPGFEYEAVLQTNFQVAVYSIDGTTAPGSPVAVYALNTHSQISMALSTDGNNPDYFYDWYIPLSAIGTPASFRLSATTVTAPSSALQGSRSDIYGINDATSGSAANGWTTVINQQPPITTASIGSAGSGPGPVCTNAPVLTAPVNTGSNIGVGGTWTRLDAGKPATATITLFRNGVSAGTTMASTGGSWSIVVPTIAPGDVFYARAQATGESSCLGSNPVTAACAATPAAPTITCASTKGITGTIPLGTAISIYQVLTTQNNPTATPLTTGLVYINNATNRTFDYFGTNIQSGNACQGQNNILPSTSSYMLITNNNGCLSAPTFICITGASQTQWNYAATNAIAITGTIYSFQTSVSGTGAASGQILRLFVNNQYVTALTATGSTFTFTGLTLKAGDVLRVYAQASAACITQSTTFTVSCYLQPPVITTSSAGNLAAGTTTIAGSSATAGATIQLYRGTAPSGTLVGSATAAPNGSWAVGSLTVSAGESYYATQTSGGCTSPASTAASSLAATTACPTFSAASFAETATTVGGTITPFTGTVRVYLDGVLIGNTALTNGTTWSIPVNTAYNNTLYAGGVLTITAQATAAAENTSCAATATVTCTAPQQPGVSPLTSTINAGQMVTFAVSNVAAGTWYSVRNSSGVSYATAVYSTGSGNFNLTTNAFTSPGIYQLDITADRLTGCSPSLRTATISVGSTLPVIFVQVDLEERQGTPLIRWTVSNEQEVHRYDVERSSNCRDFTPIGSVTYKAPVGTVNNYAFHDKQPPINDKYCYRIRQVDKDGQSIYSQVLTRQTQPVTLTWTVMPNPAHAKATVAIQSPEAVNGILLLMNTHGVVLRTIRVRLPKGSSVLTIDGLNKYPAGTYILTLNNERSLLVRRLIIEH